MKIPISLLVEALSSASTRAFDHVFSDIRIIRDKIERPAIETVQMCLEDMQPTGFDENAVYILDAAANDALDARRHPQHALVVTGTATEPQQHSWHKQAESLAFCHSDENPLRIFNSATRCLAVFAQWDARLVDAILAQRSIGEVLDIGAQALVNPIAVFDSGSALIAQSGTLPHGYETTIWGRVISDGASPMDYYTPDEQRALARKLETEPLPVILAPERAPEHANLAAAIKVRGKSRATIGQVDLVAPFSPGQTALANHVRKRLQQYFEQGSALDDHEDELVAVMRRMLDGTTADRSILSFHLRKRTWQLDDTYRVTVCPFPQGTSSRIPNTTRINNLSARLADCIAFEHNDAAVLLEHRQPGAPAANQHGNRFQAELSRLEMSAGISMWFEGISNTTAQYRQALICLAEAERSGLSGALRYQDVFESHIAHLVANSAPPESICHPGVLALTTRGYKGSVEQGHELIEQLYAYLASGRNLHRCARLLFMHHNTLAYRIERLQQVLGLDFAELAPSEVVHLEISCLLALKA